VGPEGVDTLHVLLINTYGGHFQAGLGKELEEAGILPGASWWKNKFLNPEYMDFLARFETEKERTNAHVNKRRKMHALRMAEAARELKERSAKAKARRLEREAAKKRAREDDEGDTCLVPPPRKRQIRGR